MSADTPRTWTLTLNSPDGAAATELRGLSHAETVDALYALVHGVPMSTPTASEPVAELVAA